MIMIGGASPTYQNGMDSFQEERQVQIASPFCKYAHAVEHTHRVPFYVEQAVRQSIYGRPGAVYLDMPDDIIQGEVDEDEVEAMATIPEPPRMQAMPGERRGGPRCLGIGGTAARYRRQGHGLVQG